MTPTLTRTMTTTNQNSAPKPGLCRNDSLRIRRAMAYVTGAMKGKPEPNDFWYDLTRADAELRNTHLDLSIIRCRQALEEAKVQGVGVQAATAHRVELFFATACAMALHGYEVAGNESLSTQLVRLSEETADVVKATARAQAEPSERNLEALRMEIHEVIEVGEAVADRTAMHILGSGSR